MVKLMAAVAVVVVLWAQQALAQAAETELEEAIRDNPARFEARMLDLIAGFGGADGLTPAGIEDHIALERAAARASALRRFHAMDLDADGRIARGELAVVQRAASANTRGRMERQFLSADSNADGALDAAEIAAQGQSAALRALGEDDVTLLRAALTLDSDGNGALSVAELQAAVVRIEGGA